MIPSRKKIAIIAVAVAVARVLGTTTLAFGSVTPGTKVTANSPKTTFRRHDQRNSGDSDVHELHGLCHDHSNDKTSAAFHLQPSTGARTLWAARTRS